MPKKGFDKKFDDFVGLHNHSDFSALDGAATVKGYMEECARRGSPALALTDHGSMRGFYESHIQGEKTNVKPIYGIEFYVANDMERRGLTSEEKEAIGSKGRTQTEKKELVKQYELEKGIRDRWHITAWAENERGLKNLFKLSTLAYKKGFYYKPRIDLETLCEYNEGVCVGTGCISSPFHDMAIKGKKRKAMREAEALYEVFGERFFIELQPHNMVEQRKANQFGLALQQKLGDVKTLATQDAHYIQADDHLTHEVMLCIGTRDKMSNPDRFRFSETGFYFKNRKQMMRSFEKNHKYMTDAQIKASLDNTVLFAERCSAKLEIDYHKTILPNVPLPSGFETDFEYIKYLCLEGFKKRLTAEHIARVASKKGLNFDEMFRVYTERLKFELNVLRKQKFIKYFLIVEDLYRWVREQGIMYGPGRGSAAGSIVTFLLNVTVVDPIEHSLLFERFISEDRIDLPDIDCDFEKSRRQEILDHVREQYGEDKVCQITTISKLTGKQCIKDVSRVFGVPFHEANEITNNILDDKTEESNIAAALNDSTACKEFDKKYPDVFKHAVRLEGMSKHLGVHAGGIIITPTDLTDYLPVEKRKHHDKEILVSSIDKDALEALGLVKFDFLGLKTLTILRETTEFIKKFENIDFEIYADLAFDDKETLKGFNQGDFVGVFQFDTPGAEKLCEGVKFKSFEDIVTMTSLNRPGATRSGLAAQYLDKKIRKKKFESLHEKIDEIAQDSLGVLVYQEHIMRIFSELAGYSLSDADKIRKKISKSKGPEELEKEREGFVEGASENGIPEETANKIMDTVIAFGGYAFTRAHAVAYSIISYWCMYLKQHYPLCYYCAALRGEDTKEKVQLVAKDAKKHGISVLPPHVSISGKDFSIDYKMNAIRAGLLDLKSVGEKAAGSVSANAPYSDFEDFVSRVNRRVVNKGVALSLLKADTFGGLVPNQKWLIERFEDIWPLLSVDSKKKLVFRMIERSKKKPDYTENERKMIALKYNPSMSDGNIFDIYEEFMNENVVVPITRIADEGFFETYDEQGVYIAGMVLDTKIHKVGDYHTGEELTDAEKQSKNFGARFAKMNIEDISGENIRIKFDYDVFEDMQKVIEAPFGTPILAHCQANARWKSLRVNFAVDLETYREKLQKKEELSIWENIIRGRHPAMLYRFKNAEERKRWIFNERFKKCSVSNLFCGVVTNVQEKIDKNGNKMAFFGMLGADNYFTRVICFTDAWLPLRKQFLPGRLFKLDLEKGKRSKFGKNEKFNGGMVQWLKV